MSTSKTVFWWSVTGRHIKDNRFEHHNFRAASEPEARKTFEYLCGCENPVEIISITWSRSQISDCSDKSHPMTLTSEPPLLFWSEGQCVHGPMRQTKTGIGYFFLKTFTAAAAEAIAVALNEFAHAWISSNNTKSMTMHQALESAIKPEELDRMADFCDSEVIDKFRAAALEMHQVDYKKKEKVAHKKPKHYAKSPSVKRNSKLITVDMLMGKRP